jgi:hypothetical protein
MSSIWHREIYTATEECDKVFCDYIDNPIAKNVATAKKLQFRLQVWDRYAGARAKKGYRLDDRLEGLQDIRDVFLASLGLVAHLLKGGKTRRVPWIPLQESIRLKSCTVNNDHTNDVELPRSEPHDDAEDFGEQESISETSTETHRGKPGEETVTVQNAADDIHDSAGDQEMSQTFQKYQRKPWGEIVVALSNLFVLMKRVRETPAAGLEGGVSPNFHRADDGYYRDLCHVLIRSKFRHARSTLTDLIGDSIYFRRRRLLYRRFRQEKLQSSFERKKSSKESDLDQESRESCTVRDEQLEQRKTLEGETNCRVMVSQATTGITKFPRNQASRLLRQQSQVSGSVKGQRVAIQHRLDYPPIPEGDAQTGFAYCDYCSEPMNIPISEDDWK